MGAISQPYGAVADLRPAPAPARPDALRRPRPPERRHALARDDRGSRRVPAAGSDADRGACTHRPDVRARAAHDPAAATYPARSASRDGRSRQAASATSATTRHACSRSIPTCSRARSTASSRSASPAGSASTAARRTSRAGAGAVDEPHLGGLEPDALPRGRVSAVRDDRLRGARALYELMPRARPRPRADGRLDRRDLRGRRRGRHAAVARGRVRLSLAGVTTLEEVRRITGDRRAFQPRHAARATRRWPPARVPRDTREPS